MVTEEAGFPYAFFLEKTSRNHLAGPLPGPRLCNFQNGSFKYISNQKRCQVLYKKTPSKTRRTYYYEKISIKEINLSIFSLAIL